MFRPAFACCINCSRIPLGSWRRAVLGFLQFATTIEIAQPWLCACPPALRRLSQLTMIQVSRDHMHPGIVSWNQCTRFPDSSIKEKCKSLSQPVFTARESFLLFKDVAPLHFPARYARESAAYKTITCSGIQRFLLRSLVLTQRANYPLPSPPS